MGRRLFLAAAGFLPVTSIAATCFGIAGLHTLAACVLVPTLMAVAWLAGRAAWVAGLVTRAVAAGIVATALYDLFRFGFLWSGLMHGDPIPHIGAALGLHPDAAFGYLWRYLLNGAGLAVAFAALGGRGVRAGIAYGLFVCGGLLTTLALSPHGQQILFPLSATSVAMATGGHMIYGGVLGALLAPDRATGVSFARAAEARA